MQEKRAPPPPSRTCNGGGWPPPPSPPSPSPRGGGGGGAAATAATAGKSDRGSVPDASAAVTAAHEEGEGDTPLLSWSAMAAAAVPPPPLPLPSSPLPPPEGLEEGGCERGVGGKRYGGCACDPSTGPASGNGGMELCWVLSSPRHFKDHQPLICFHLVDTWHFGARTMYWRSDLG